MKAWHIAARTIEWLHENPDSGWVRLGSATGHALERRLRQEGLLDGLEIRHRGRELEARLRVPPGAVSGAI